MIHDGFDKLTGLDPEDEETMKIKTAKKLWISGYHESRVDSVVAIKFSEISFLP